MKGFKSTQLFCILRNYCTKGFKSNTEGNLTDWSRKNQTATVTFAWIPALTWDGFVSYNYQKLENSAPGCIAIFDG